MFIFSFQLFRFYFTDLQSMNTAQSCAKSSNDERKHVCENCRKYFKSNSALIIHKRIHSGEKPHNCDVCGKRFTQKGDLTRHKLTHSGLKIYQCDICKICFARRGNLKQHTVVHT